MKKLLIFGAGSGSREIHLMVHQINNIKPEWDVLGFVDEDPELIGTEVDGYPVYGPSHKEIAKDVYGVCGILEPKIRKRMVEENIEGKGLSLATIIFPSINIPHDFDAGPGTIIMPLVTISFDVKLGKCVLVLFGAALGHHLRSGDYSSILSFATIIGGCSIGHRTTIGAKATLNFDVSIGNDSLVGVGTTVLQDIGDNKSIMSLPRQIISDR